MAGTKSTFEKWEPNVAARLISMSSCDWPLQESRLRQHRANAKIARSVELKLRWIGFYEDDERRFAEGAINQAARPQEWPTRSEITAPAAIMIFIRAQLGVPP